MLKYKDFLNEEDFIIAKLNGKKELIVDPTKLTPNLILESNMQRWYKVILNITNLKKKQDEYQEYESLNS